MNALGQRIDVPNHLCAGGEIVRALVGHLNFRRGAVIILAANLYGKRRRAFNEAHRIGLALENILVRQRGLDQQIGERVSGQKAILSAMQDGLLVVDRDRRLALVNPAFCDLFKIGKDSLGAPLLTRTTFA